MKTAHFVGIVLAVGIVTNSEAQTTTDVPQTISKLLSDFGAVPYTTDQKYWTVCRAIEAPRGAYTYPCQKSTPATNKVILSASNISIVSRPDIQFSAPVYTDYPNDLKANFATIRNCNELPAPPSSQTPPSTQVTLSTMITRTTSVTISNSFTNGGSTTFGFSLGNPLLLGIITGGIQ